MRPSKSVSLPLLLLFLSVSSAALTFAQAHGRVLYPLPAYPACGQPLTPLIADADGNLYGTDRTAATHTLDVFLNCPLLKRMARDRLTFLQRPGRKRAIWRTRIRRAGNLYGTAGQPVAPTTRVLFLN